MGTLASVRNLTLTSPEKPGSPLWALIRAWLPTLFWIGIICFESTSLFTSDHTQSWLYSGLKAVFGAKLAAYAPMLNEYSRKLGHFTGYGILSLLSFLGWTEWLAYRAQARLTRMGKQLMVQRRWHLRAAVLAVLLTFAVACLDEFHQSMVPGRTAMFRDVILDTMGGIFAQLLIVVFWKQWTRKPMKPQPVLQGVAR